MDRKIPESLRDAVFTDDKSMVQIEYTLSGYGGAKTWIEVDRALLGEAYGRWKIIRRPQTYDNKMMTAKTPPDSLTRDGFFSNGVYETKEIKKKKIAWIQDVARIGGAEISNLEMIRVGNDCGFNITVITPESLHGSDQLKPIDLIILNNIWHFSQEQMAAILRVIYSGTPYVKYEHDYRELQRPDFSKKIFGLSKLNVFLSPKHLKDYQKELGCGGTCLPLAIDVSHFKSIEKVERKKDSALVFNTPNQKFGKSGEEFIKSHPQMMFTILSNGGPLINGGNIKLSPPVPYGNLPTVYSAHEFLVHLPDRDWAGERIIFEAALSGCKVVANDHVGHMSWGRDLTDVKGLSEWLVRAPYEFWKEVARI